MRLVRCAGERCTATYPADAAFCPRCGRHNDYREVPAPVLPRRRWRPFRPAKVIIGLVIAICVVRGMFRSSVPPPQQQPATPAIAPSEQIDSDVTAALSSLESFAQAKKSWAGRKSEKDRFAELVSGKRVRWTGKLRTSWGPSSPRLLSTDPAVSASIKMMPATDEAREQLKQIPANVTVEIEGVLMDDQWLHLLSIHVVE